MRGTRALSKSRFIAGSQCPKLLWWTVHERDAPELAVGPALQDRFDQGTEVGRVACEQFPGGELIDLPHYPLPPRVEATREALRRSPPAIFEASFLKDGVYCAVDILERTPEGYGLIEVKSSRSMKDIHVMDAAVQTLAVRASGLPVARVEVMHLNKEHRHPDQGDLFVREDVTPDVEALLPGLPARVAELLAVLEGPVPDVEIGSHCFRQRPCPFMGRCWPSGPGAIGDLAGVGPSGSLDFIQRGILRVEDLPEGEPLSPLARRQLQAERTGRPFVDSGLEQALHALQEPLGFLDFETVGRALPRWEGTRPWQAIPVQFSYHELQPDGSLHHAEWLAKGPGDPREAMAEALVRVCRSAHQILHYTSFEKGCLRTLAEGVPALAGELQGIEDRLADLYPIIKDHVYHPGFRGSFSIKKVLPALVPELGYDDLAIEDGQVASVRIARMMFHRDAFSEAEVDQERRHLLEYCKRDTLAMVELLQALRDLVSD